MMMMMMMMMIMMIMKALMMKIMIVMMIRIMIPDLNRCLGSTSSRFIQINTCENSDNNHVHGDDDHD
jgi:hypothetical protein